MNSTASSSIVCRSASSWELLESAVEKAAKVAEKVWSWGRCREETGVAILLTVILGLAVLVTVLLWVERFLAVFTFTSSVQG